MPNDGKTAADVYQRFPKNRKTLGVRWLKRHGVTTPLLRTGGLTTTTTTTTTFTALGDSFPGVTIRDQVSLIASSD